MSLLHVGKYLIGIFIENFHWISKGTTSASNIISAYKNKRMKTDNSQIQNKGM